MVDEYRGAGGRFNETLGMGSSQNSNHNYFLSTLRGYVRTQKQSYYSYP